MLRDRDVDELPGYLPSASSSESISLHRRISQVESLPESKASKQTPLMTMYVDVIEEIFSERLPESDSESFLERNLCVVTMALHMALFLLHLGLFIMYFFHTEHFIHLPPKNQTLASTGVTIFLQAISIVCTCFMFAIIRMRTDFCCSPGSQC